MLSKLFIFHKSENSTLTIALKTVPLNTFVQVRGFKMIRDSYTIISSWDYVVDVILEAALGAETPFASACDGR